MSANQFNQLSNEQWKKIDLIHFRQLFPEFQCKEILVIEELLLSEKSRTKSTESKERVKFLAEFNTLMKDKDLEVRIHEYQKNLIKILK